MEWHKSGVNDISCLTLNTMNISNAPALNDDYKLWSEIITDVNWLSEKSDTTSTHYVEFFRWTLNKIIVELFTICSMHIEHLLLAIFT